MRVVIDIPEEEYIRICDEPCTELALAVRNGTVLPDNPTNGDMIMAVFPNASITEIGGGSTIVVANDYKFNSTWWNTPYREGKE